MKLRDSKPWLIQNSREHKKSFLNDDEPLFLK
jgi:hypothetical protein